MRLGIVLGGGGAKGSFQAGVLKYISELPEIKIVAITGTSVGALNGALSALGKFDKILELWKSISDSNSFYPNYTFGKTYGIIKNGSVYSNSWLKEHINKNIPLNEILNCEAFFGCCSSDLVSGNSIFANNTEGRFSPNFLDYILASASLPPAFPSIKVDGFNLVDGGISSPIPVKEILTFNVAIDKIIIIPAGSTKLIEDHSKGFFNENIRVLDVLYTQLFNNSLEKGIAKFWSLNKKFVLVDAIKNICSTLDTDSTKINNFIEHGYLRAKEILKDLND